MGSTIVVLPGEVVPGKDPVGSGGHVVKDGECISMLAAEHGLKTDDIFDHPDNSELKAVRRNPNVLLPRDRVAIPKLELKNQPAVTDANHPFVLVGEPVFLQIQIKDQDKPVTNEPFVLTVEGVTTEGVTDGSGKIKIQIPPTATAGFLTVGPPDNLLQMNLKLGTLHPVESNTGVQQRLQNLGFDCGKIDGIVGPLTRGSIRAFQKTFGLDEDGILTPEVRDLLRQKHGC